jgi:amino acid transporter
MTDMTIEGRATAAPAASSADADAADLQKMGYAQQLLREMGGFSNFAVSFSVISILTGGIQLFGYGLNHGGPLQMTVGWCLAAVFTTAVAMSMAELASAYPTAGALYHWASFLGGRRLGWFTACFNTIGMFSILAAIDIGLANFILGALGMDVTFVRTLLLSAALLLSHAALNHMGMKLVAFLNSFSAWYHMAVVFILIAALAVKGSAQPPSFLLEKFNGEPGFSYPYTFLVGLLLAQWTLTGYDASAHVSEETCDPRRNAPWGIFLSVVISVVFGLAMLVAVTLSIPDLQQAAGFGDNAFTEILKLRLGANLGGAIVWSVLGAMWLCGLAAMTSASRMVWAFARDGGMPFSKWWAAVSPAHRTPSNAIWGLTALALLLTVSVDVFTAVVSISTIALYISYGLPILARLFARARGEGKTVGPWNLGAFSVPVAIVALLWIVFITVLFVLPPNQKAGIVMVPITLGLVVLWFAYVGKRFRGPPVNLK